MRTLRRTAGVIAWLGAVAAGVAAQEGQGAAREAYFGAVAEFFQMPRSEVSILGEWRLAAEEIPVVLFLARRAGVSPEAVVALRRSGRGWTELAGRYRLDASQFHVPLPDAAPAGVLAEAYGRYRALPASRWAEVTLGDDDIVGLVNLRLLSQTLRLAPDAVLAGGGGSGGWVELYARLVGDTGDFGAEGAAP